MSRATTARRTIVILVAVAALLLLGVWGLSHLWDKTKGAFTATECTFGDYRLDPDQAAVASTMVGVVTQRALPERADVLVLAAAMQESKLTNIPAGQGDRDSVGVLQQRPSQGWGTQAQLSDVHYATRAFLDALVKVDNWQTEPLADAIQTVQVSADGSAYAQHEGMAQALADALTGTKPAAISCSFDTPTQVASVATVATQLQQDLPVNTPATSGYTVSVPGARWQTTAWFVANADRLGIDSVAYGGRTWTRADGWQSGSASAAQVVATMHH